MDTILPYFWIKDDTYKVTPAGPEEFQQVVDRVKELGLAQMVVNLSLQSVLAALRKKIVPHFWKKFIDYAEKGEEYEDEHPVDGAVNCFASAVDQMHSDVMKLRQVTDRCEVLCSTSGAKWDKMCHQNETLGASLKHHFRATLHSQIPPCFQILLGKVYKEAFKVYCHIQGYSQRDELTTSLEEVSLCGGCQAPSDDCRCHSTCETFDRVNQKLCDLKIFEALLGNVISDVLLSAIEEHVTITCRDSYDQPQILSLEKWLENIVTGWLEFVYCGTAHKPEGTPADIQTMIRNSLNRTYHTALYHTYTTTRIGQLFNIVIDFPESQPALEDIRQCLEETNLRTTLVQSLKSAIQTRLLHPAVNTEDVLQAYVSLIKALRILDPRGILLELVSEPIRQYLRSRNDFVRYIVTNLTDDSWLELSEELMVSAPLVLDDSYTETESMDDWETWSPDPVHAQNVKSKSQRTADIISMLFNIYGSKDVFITEYRTILADRILSQYNYDSEREVRYLEHLKVRCGETPALHKCEVMVKDIADSKRINASIHSDQNTCHQQQSFPVLAMILSAQFWPSFKEESLQLPEVVLQELKMYTEAYQGLKGNRTLNWKYHLGQVELEIEVKNQTFNLTVTPIQATIIYHFAKMNRWTLDDLSLTTLVPQASLRRKMTFWLSQGLIKEVEPDVYALVEEDDMETNVVPSCFVGGNSAADRMAMANTSLGDDEAESVMASAQDQRQEELQVLWSYIVGMLTNLNTLPLERIHAMLKMFVQDSVECTLEELKEFLEVKVRKHEIIFASGVYKLPNT